MGQEHPKDILRRAVERDRLHHGLLFVGPTGVGKLATALSLARILQCEKREEGTFAEACEVCPGCRKLQNDLQHPDVRVIRPEGASVKFIKIDQVRGIQKLAMTRPYEGRYQIVVFDDVHLMTDEAANALLKTLEEPPVTMRLILVTDQPQSLLDTIRSRSQTIRFGALEREAVVKILRASEDVPDEQSLAVAAAFGEGSAGRAREIIDGGVLAERRELFEMLSGLRRENTVALLGEAERLGKDRKSLDLRLDLLKILLRDMMLMGLGVDRSRLVNGDLSARLESAAANFDVEGLIVRIESIRTAQDLLSRNVNATMVVENLLTELAPGPIRRPIHIPRHLR